MRKRLLNMPSIKGRKKIFYMMGIIFMGIILVNFFMPGTTYSKSSFELMEGIGGWQIFDPYNRLYGYTGDIYTTDEQSYSGNFSLKFSTPTSYFYEVEGGYAVSTVALVLFFENPVEGKESDIYFEYEIDGETYSSVYPTLRPILKDELVINPNIEFAIYAEDHIRARIDITAWDYDGNAIGRNTGSLIDLDPESDWFYYKQNAVDAISSEVGSHWIAIRSIEIRLYDERALLQESYGSKPCEIYIDDFKFYTGDPDAVVDYDDGYAEFTPFECSFAVLGIVYVAYKNKRDETE